MKRLSILAFGIGVLLLSFPAAAQDKLVVSIWGGSWRDLVAETVAKKFTQETGVAVEFITGGTIDRLNKAKLAKGNPESDLNFTTSHECCTRKHSHSAYGGTLAHYGRRPARLARRLYPLGAGNVRPGRNDS